MAVSQLTAELWLKRPPFNSQYCYGFSLRAYLKPDPKPIETSESLSGILMGFGSDLSASVLKL